MPWVKASDFVPGEGERVLVHDGGRDGIKVGRYVGGAWFVEDSGGGGLTRVEGVTHWAPVLDSEDYDPADD